MEIAKKQILITAGPTREAIDPVRYISNHSTGKMGIAIAEAFAALGAEVILVKGPTNEKTDSDRILTIDVNSAAEMYEACKQYFAQSDVVIFAAAVADYTPKYPASNKIKKVGDELMLELVKTKDIAYELGKLKSKGQILAGFALETDDELQNAKAKLEKKNFDLIILNSLRDKGAGFGHDTNKISILDIQGNITKFELKSKKEVAHDIVSYIQSLG